MTDSNTQLKTMGTILQSMTFDFFGGGRHKVDMEKLLGTKDAVFLDVRARPEWESLQIKLEHHIKVLWIPINEIPSRCNEIPRGPLVGIFCSSGVRSSMAYFYLRSLGYENVRIAPSNYNALAEMVMPGKIFKVIGESRPVERG